MNSCRCNSKTFWKRNLNLTGDSSLQWSSWRPLIIDLLHTVVILEHNYDIKIVTWKHKPSLNNYVSMFLFLGISYWFAFWDLCSDVCSADHIFCPCVRLCFPCRGCRSRIHTSAAPEGSSASLECHRELPHKKPHIFGSQAQVFFSSFPMSSWSWANRSLQPGGLFPFLSSWLALPLLPLCWLSPPTPLWPQGQPSIKNTQPQ